MSSPIGSGREHVERGVFLNSVEYFYNIGVKLRFTKTFVTIIAYCTMVSTFVSGLMALLEPSWNSCHGYFSSESFSRNYVFSFLMSALGFLGAWNISFIRSSSTDIQRKRHSLSFFPFLVSLHIGSFYVFTLVLFLVLNTYFGNFWTNILDAHTLQSFRAYMASETLTCFKKYQKVEFLLFFISCIVSGGYTIFHFMIHESLWKLIVPVDDYRLQMVVRRTPQEFFDYYGFYPPGFSDAESVNSALSSNRHQVQGQERADSTGFVYKVDEESLSGLREMSEDIVEMMRDAGLLVPSTTPEANSPRSNNPEFCNEYLDEGTASNRVSWLVRTNSGGDNYWRSQLKICVDQRSDTISEQMEHTFDADSYTSYEMEAEQYHEDESDFSPVPATATDSVTTESDDDSGLSETTGKQARQLIEAYDLFLNCNSDMPSSHQGSDPFFKNQGERRGAVSGLSWQPESANVFLNECASTNQNQSDRIPLFFPNNLNHKENFAFDLAPSCEPVSKSAKNIPRDEPTNPNDKYPSQSLLTKYPSIVREVEDEFQTTQTRDDLAKLLSDFEKARCEGFKRTFFLRSENQSDKSCESQLPAKPLISNSRNLQKRVGRGAVCEPKLNFFEPNGMGGRAFFASNIGDKCLKNFQNLESSCSSLNDAQGTQPNTILANRKNQHHVEEKGALTSSFPQFPNINSAPNYWRGETGEGKLKNNGKQKCCSIGANNLVSPFTSIKTEPENDGFFKKIEKLGSYSTYFSTAEINNASGVLISEADFKTTTAKKEDNNNPKWTLGYPHYSCTENVSEVSAAINTGAELNEGENTPINNKELLNQPGKDIDTNHIENYQSFENNRNWRSDQAHPP